MNQKVLNKVFVWGFLFLYLLVALISFCHAVEFFNIGNVQWMSISLAFAFELGLALSLASILLSDKNKKQTLPWILMGVLTTVQVIGNIYSVFKHISISETDYYQYLAKPLLFFIEEVDENTIKVIVSWIMGAILPIVALMMTDMVATNLQYTSEKDETTNEIKEEKEILESKEDEVKEPVKEEKKIVPEKIEKHEQVKQEKEEEKKEEIKKDGKPKKTLLERLKTIVEPVSVDNHKSHTYKASENYYKSPEIDKK